MKTWIRVTALCLLLSACLAGSAGAVSLGIDWKQAPILADNRFSGVTLTPDASLVYAGGAQMIVRSWDGNFHWGGFPGFTAAMSPDGNFMVTSSGNTISLVGKNGVQNWSRNMDGQIRAVAISRNGSFIISADDRGNYNAWGPNGDFYGRNRSDVVKHLAISPAENLVVATTERGIRYFTPGLNPVWTDDRPGSLDDLIIISDDGSTVITAGGTRVSSHTETGGLTWQADETKSAINDIACSSDCSIIIVGSQDNTVLGIDRYGKIHWTFPTGQWANAVSASRDGSVIAAGANDGTLFVLDHGGNLLTQRKLDGPVQLHTVAVSRDGRRIVAADFYNLYGMSVIGMGAGEGSDTIFVAPPLNPVRTTTTPVPVTTEPVVTTLETVPGTPEPVPTQKSPAGGLLPLCGGLATAALLAALRKT